MLIDVDNVKQAETYFPKHMAHVLNPIYQLRMGRCVRDPQEGVIKKILLEYIKAKLLWVCYIFNNTHGTCHKWVCHIFKNTHGTCLISNFLREVD